MKDYTMAQRMYDYEISKGIAINSDLESFILTHIDWISDDYSCNEDIIDLMSAAQNVVTEICNKMQDRIESIYKYE